MCCNILCCTWSLHAVLCCAVLCCAVGTTGLLCSRSACVLLCCAVLCCAVLCCAVLAWAGVPCAMLCNIEPLILWCMCPCFFALQSCRLHPTCRDVDWYLLLPFVSTAVYFLSVCSAVSCSMPCCSRRCRMPKVVIQRLQEAGASTLATH